MKYRELYHEGMVCLQRAEVAEASLDARLLLEYVCHTDRNRLLAHGDEEVENGQAVRYRALLGERAAHIPLQYLTGCQEFMGLPFFVNDQVLIPRQDTEILVEEAMRELHDGMSILDMCTGSGCILQGGGCGKGHPSHRDSPDPGCFRRYSGVPLAAVGLSGFPEKPGHLQCQMRVCYGKAHVPGGCAASQGCHSCGLVL